MNRSHVASRVLVTGPSGSGKTTLALRMARAWYASRRYIFDHDDQFGHQLGLPVQDTFAECEAELAAGNVCVFNPERLYGRETGQGFNAFCRFVFRHSEERHGVSLLIAEELDSFVTLRGKIPWAFGDCLRLGRRREIDMLLITQSPADVNPTIRNQLTHVAAFRFTDTLPLRWLTESPLLLPEKTLSTLPDHAYIWKIRGQETYQTIAAGK